MTVPRYAYIDDHLIVRVYPIDPSRCRDLSLGLVPYYSSRGWEIFRIAIFGFLLSAFRGWRRNWFSAELPSMVVYGTASTLTFFKSFFYQRRGNSLQGFLLVRLDWSLTCSFFNFFAFLRPRLPSWLAIRRDCYQQFRVTRLRFRFRSGPDGLVQVVTPKTGAPTEFRDRVEQDSGFIFRFLKLCLQLSIWVLIISWHGQYINSSTLAALSPPALKFAIGLIFVEWLWNNGLIWPKLVGFQLRPNQYLSDRKSERGRWKCD